MRILRSFFTILLMFFLTVTSADNLSKDQIFSLVENNHELLQECVDARDYKRAEQIAGIQSARAGRLTESAYVEFYCGGYGLVPSSSYYGFYYSPKDIPLAIDVTQTKNLRSEGNGFAWHENWERAGADNSYYTERIMERWYYYESHF